MSVLKFTGAEVVLIDKKNEGMLIKLRKNNQTDVELMLSDNDSAKLMSFLLKKFDLEDVFESKYSLKN